MSQILTPGRRLRLWRFVLLAGSLALGSARAAVQAHASASTVAPPIAIVAAENFYGDVARQIGGPRVAVTSILSNPDQDPHLFEASPATARAIAGARLVIYNGADYDPWMSKLLRAAPTAGRVEIVAAELTGKRAGDNPHLWYAPQTMPAVARALEASLEQADPAGRDSYRQGLARFLASLRPIDAKVAALRGKYRGRPVTATEPVFGYMAEALGLQMRNGRFQLAIMNDTEPSAAEVAAFERDLRQRRVSALIYNSQAQDQTTQRLLGIAKASGVPSVSVTETEPRGLTFQTWMLNQLDALDRALGGASGAARNRAP